MLLTIARSAPTALTAPIIRGRDRELAIVVETLDRVRSGGGAVLPVEGRAGMGKRRFLAEAERMARRLSFGAVKGSADPGESVVEMSALLGALAEGPNAVISAGRPVAMSVALDTTRRG